MKKKGKGMFLPCPEEAAVIWILQITYFFILTNELENWERGWGKKSFNLRGGREDAQNPRMYLKKRC